MPDKTLDQQAGLAAANALGREVAIGQIESHLRELWVADQASTKASLINLVVYSERPGALGGNSAIMEEITRDHACRALLVEARLDTNEQSRARAWITAHCNLVGGLKAVCSEQIAFELIGKATGRIRNIVFAHLLADLPLVFWWQGPLSRIFEPRLYRLIDRLVIDSSDWPRDQLANSLEAVMAARKESRQALALHDLNWTRCHQMRMAFALLFDTKSAQAAIAAPRQLEIEGSRSALPALLQLAAWVARALGWHLVSARPEAARYETREGMPVEVHFLAQKETDRPLVSRMALACEGGQFETARDESGRYIEARAECGGSSGVHLVPADPVQPAALLSSLLGRAGGNQLLCQTLPDFAELARALKQ